MPEPTYYDQPHEKLAREEGKRLVEMYAPGTEPHYIGNAILLVLLEKKEAELELRKAQRQLTKDAADLPKARGSFSVTCPNCGTFIGVDFAKSASG